MEMAEQGGVNACVVSSGHNDSGASADQAPRDAQRISPERFFAAMVAETMSDRPLAAEGNITGLPKPRNVCHARLCSAKNAEPLTA
jgi:hypothetical protein